MLCCHPWLGSLMWLLRRGPLCLRRLLCEVLRVGPGSSLCSFPGERCGGSVLPGVWLCLRCKFGRDAQIGGTFGTNSGGLSIVSFDVLCPWLMLLPPWKESLCIPRVWWCPWLQQLPWDLPVSLCRSRQLQYPEPCRACLPLWWVLLHFGIARAGPETELWFCAWRVLPLLAH